MTFILYLIWITCLYLWYNNNEMKSIEITEKHREALELINKSTSNIWSHPKGARGGKDYHDDCCEYCGKKIKDDKVDYFHIITSGVIIPCSIDEEIIYDLYNANLIKDQSQGCFPIGSTCAKKLLGDKVEFYLS